MAKAQIIILGSSAASPFPRTKKNQWADYLTANYQKKFHLHDDPICNLAKKGGPNRRTRSVIAIKTAKTTIIFDAGPDIFYQLKKFKIRPQIAFLSHEHSDANYHAEDLKKIGVKIYGELEKNIKPDKSVSIENIKIMPFRVRHVKNVKTVGYKIFIGQKKIAIATDISSTAGLKKYFRNCDIILADGSILSRNFGGHLPIIRQLQIYKKWNLKKVFFTHIGHSTLPHNELVKFVRSKYKNTDVAYDGLKIKI